MKNKAKKQSKKQNDKKLQKLNKIAHEHFRTLTPIFIDKEGNYLRNARIYNYEDLGYTLESLLNICIMALDGFELNNKKRNIKEVHKQFADVLEFTKNLIPHEELEFLDKSRKLLLENNRNTR